MFDKIREYYNLDKDYPDWYILEAMMYSPRSVEHAIDYPKYNLDMLKNIVHSFCSIEKEKR